MATTIYLDHNATTPVDPRVLERFLSVEREYPGNPASLHRTGRQARSIVEQSRERIAARLHRTPADVVFTSGGTEANNLAVLGLGDAARPVLLAAVEHPSVREPASVRGIAAWAVDPEGRARIEPPAQPVGLVCLVHAQSEVGTVQPVAAAVALAAHLAVPLHVDAAQTVGRLPLDELEPVDSIALSPHKFGGLRGVGILAVRDAATRLRPLLRGGGQEHGLRPGTVSPALAASAALALDLALDEQPARRDRMARARRACLQELDRSGIDYRCVTPLHDSIPNTAMLSFPGLDGRVLLPALDLAGIAAAHGSACSSGSPSPPAVLAAMGLTTSAARGCVRVSFGRGDHEGFAAQAGVAIASVVARLQKKN